jgi:murein DD-endopeptidase MepM/ murein hydrolase activator NlpD
MYGVPKFKEGFFLKHKKEMISILCGVMALFAAIGSTPANSIWIANSYRVVINDNDLGRVKTEEEAEEALKLAKTMVEEELGYDPEVELTMDFYVENSKIGTVLSKDKLAKELKTEILASIDDIKEKAYIMKIGDDFTVALESEDDIKQVLENAQSKYLADDINVDVELKKDENNGLIMVPEVVMLKENDISSRMFSTAALMNENVADVKNAEAKSEDVNKEKAGLTVDVGFSEPVMVVEGYAYASDIKDVNEATDLITKENEEEKTYNIEKGDCPSIIAEKNDMSLNDLYNLNPGLENNESKIQIGDEVVVMVPEPELSVSVKDEIVYKQPIARGTTYIDNPKKYVGSNSVIDNGYDGEKQVTALITKVNGNEVNREIINEKVLKEPKDKVVSKGTKPLPAKSATGRFIKPLTRYRLSSPFGYRWGRLHQGVDMAAPTGTPIRAADGGVVKFAGWSGSYGYMIEINHGKGITTRYAHCSRLNVKVGQRVAQYEEIGRVGSTGRSTGPHVHFEVRFDGVPRNPMKYL